jgi:signal transduction histidine kinase
MGDYYFKQEKYSLALEKYLQSLNYVKQMGNKYHLCEISTVLALTYHKLNQDGKALQYILQAEELAEEVGVRTKLKEIYLTRAEIEQKAGNYKLASEYFSKTLEVSDSLFKTETSEKVAEVEAQYQNEKKQKEIGQLEKDKQIQSLTIRQKSTLNYILIGSLVALLVVAFLIYRNLQQRQRIKQQQINELEKDKQLVAVDAMLKGQEEERSRLAKDLHDGLGGLLSGVKFSLSNMKDNLVITPENMTVFERSLDMIDTSIKELRRVAHNMMPEMLTKFGLDEALKEYCNTINATQLLAVKYQSLGMDTRVDKSTEIIIYRIIQELLNNVMKHASASEAMVQLIKGDGRFSIMVEDNGKGFDTALLKSSKGAGLTSIRSRVDYLKGRLDIHSEQGKGTLVNIEFNI